MRKKSLLLSLTGAVLLLGVPAATALAHEGHDHKLVVQAAKTDNADHQTAQERQEMRAKRAQELRAKGQALIGELKQDRQEHTKAERQRVCQTRKQGLQTKLDNLAKNAAAHKKRIDSVFEKALAYQQTHNLQVADLDALVAAATTAQTAAQNSVDALTSLKPTIDCNNESVASEVAAFKVAAAQARSDLSDYRQSVKAIVQALRSAKERSQD